MARAELSTLEFSFRLLAIALLPHLSGLSLLRVSHPLRAALDRFLATLSLVGARFFGTGETGRFFFGLVGFDLLAEAFFAPFRRFAMEAARTGLHETTQTKETEEAVTPNFGVTALSTSR
jgi:hypothetical protein